MCLQIIHPSEPYCGVLNNTTGSHFNHKLKGSEPAVVDYVAVDGKNRKGLQKVFLRCILMNFVYYMLRKNTSFRVAVITRDFSLEFSLFIFI